MIRILGDMKACLLIALVYLFGNRAFQQAGFIKKDTFKGKNVKAKEIIMLGGGIGGIHGPI